MSIFKLGMKGLQPVQLIGQSVAAAIALSLLTAIGAWARPVLTVKMTVGLSVSPDYWYVVALSKSGSAGPTANLVDPNVRASGTETTYVKGWDYLIRVKPLNDQSLLQASIQGSSDQTERDFVSGFNEVKLSKTTKDRDTINLTIDLSALSQLDATKDIQVALLTIRSPSQVPPETTNLALDATRGDSPHYYRISLTDKKQVLVEDPARQETIRRSRELIGLGSGNSGSTNARIEGSSLGILAANILTFGIEIADR